MKQFAKSIPPFLILVAFCLIAGGSVEDMLLIFGIMMAVLALVSIVAIIGMSQKEAKSKEEKLNAASSKFGKYSSLCEFGNHRFILYDKDSHRLMVNDKIMDSRKLLSLKTTEKHPKTTVTYREETVTKTSTGSVIGRGVVGALVAGPVGAVIGGTTASKKTEVIKVPESHTTSGDYTITLIDEDGNERGMIYTRHLLDYKNVKSFLQNIIDENTAGTRLALQQVEEAKANALLASNAATLQLGAHQEQFNAFLHNSKDISEGGEHLYLLSDDAVRIINDGWKTLFGDFILGIENESIVKMIGISKGCGANDFKNMALEAYQLSEVISNQYGKPSFVNDKVDYTDLTDDNKEVLVYEWVVKQEDAVKVNYCIDGTRYKYEMVFEKKL